jgi:hypothetical protein
LYLALLYYRLTSTTYSIIWMIGATPWMQACCVHACCVHACCVHACCVWVYTRACTHTATVVVLLQHGGYTGGIPREWRQSAEDLGPQDLGYRCGHGEIHAVAVRARAPARTHARTRAPRAGAYARARAQAPAHAVCPYPPGPGTPYWVRCGRAGAGGPDRPSWACVQGLLGLCTGPLRPLLYDPV